MNGFVKTGEEIESLRRSSALLANVLKEVLEAALPGVTTLALDELAEKRIREVGGVPIFKGYGAGSGVPFPATICASINNEVVHGIPKKECILREGDILKIDIGMRFEGMVSDMARSIGIGNISAEAKRLLATTEESLLAGIAAIRPGGSVADYSQAVQNIAEAAGYGVVRDLVGHGVGRQLHEDPNIPNYVTGASKKIIFQPGMTVALEPMVNEGTYRVDLAPDDWTFVTADGKLSAHFEDTVLITETGTEILTRPEQLV